MVEVKSETGHGRKKAKLMHEAKFWRAPEFWGMDDHVLHLVHISRLPIHSQTLSQKEQIKRFNNIHFHFRKIL